MKHYLSEAALLITTLIWGGTFVLIKLAINDCSPLLFVSIRFSIAFIVLLPFTKKIFTNFDRKFFYSSLILGLIYFLSYAAQTTGLKYTSATKSGFITGTFIIFTPFLQVIFEKRKPTLGSILGILLAFFGLMFLSSTGNSFHSFLKELGSGFNLGDLLTLFCAFTYALYIIYLDMISKEDFNLGMLVFSQIGVTAIGGTLLALIFVPLNIQKVNFNLSNNLIIALIYTSIFATLITTILQTRFQRNVTPVKASIIYSLEPIFAAIFAYFWINEKTGLLGIVGCIFIFSGLLVSELFDKKILKNET